MTHKLILKVKFQLPNAKRFGTVEGNFQGVDLSSPPTPPPHPIPFRVKLYWSVETALK